MIDQIQRESMLYNYITGFAYEVILRETIPDNALSASLQIETWLRKNKEKAFQWAQENNIDVETEEGQMAFRLRWI